jgi:uncharacterized membrane protein (DUF485 family)
VPDLAPDLGPVLGPDPTPGLALVPVPDSRQDPDLAPTATTEPSAAPGSLADALANRFLGASEGAGDEPDTDWIQQPSALAPEPELHPEPEPEPGPEQAARPCSEAEAAAEVYRHVQAGEEFQEIRREYRSFVFPACAAFLAWYLAYIVAAVTLPDLMDRRVAGPFNVAWLLGLLQFGSTFLITWLYGRHARDRRDRMALGLRWETQDRLR